MCSESKPESVVSLAMYFMLHPYHVKPSHYTTTGALVVLKVEWCVISDKLGSLDRLVHIFIWHVVISS